MDVLRSHLHRVNVNIVISSNLFKQFFDPFLNISSENPFAVLRCPN